MCIIGCDRIRQRYTELRPRDFVAKKTISRRNQEKRTAYSGKYPFLAERLLMKVVDRPLLSIDEYGKLLAKSERSSSSHQRFTYLFKQLRDIDYVKEYGIVIGPKHQCRFKSKQYFFEMDEKERVLGFIEKNIEVEKHRKIQGKKLTKVSCPLICKFCKRTVQVKLGGNSKILTSRHWDLSFNGTFVVLSLLGDKESWDFIRSSNNEILKLAKILLENGENKFIEILQNRLRKIVKEEFDLIPIIKSWHKEMLKKIPKFRIDKRTFPEFAKYQQELKFEQQRETIMNSRQSHFFRKLD